MYQADCISATGLCVFIDSSAISKYFVITNRILIDSAAIARIALNSVNDTVFDFIKITTYNKIGRVIKDPPCRF